MKIMTKIISVAVLTAATNIAWADGTAAGTDINNTATISYKVGGVDQPDVPSPVATFKVDKKIDLSVTAGSGVSVAPGSTSQSITYELLNEGNSTETFSFTVKDDVTGDGFDPTAASCSTPANISVPPSTLLPAPVPTIITVTCNIPTGLANGLTADVDLKATAVDSGGTPYVESASDSVDTTIVDVVLADDKGSATDTGAETVTAGSGLRNASHSAVNTYTVGTATLTVGKTSAVTADPANGVSANAKRIPGATIVYTITVSNADGASDATHLVISDPIQSDLTFVSCSVSGPAVANAVPPTVALPVTCSNSVALGVAGGTVTTSSFTLPGGSGSANVETLTITATVN
jgi:uncharacterized repeat protein (TIGR01451 family)